ncbi:hypothetical protein SNE40_008191 [Patella caerulea]|uniref:Uncharacterized protein n=1 Tax=Patella caerulea TaxID=87958 RepID=A0AAN8Q3F5_PATCE
MDTTIADDTTTSKLNFNAGSTSFYTTTAQLLKTTGSEITTHGLQTTVTGTMLFSYETSEIGDTTLTGETTVMDETTVWDETTVIDGTTLTAVMDRTTPSDKTTLTDDNIQIGDTTVIYQTTVKSQITVTDDTPVIGETDATQKTILADESTVTDDKTTTVSMIVTDETFMTPHTETPAEDDESTENLHSPKQTTEDGSLMNTHENNTDTILEITTENQIFPETTVAAKTTHKLKISTETIITETPLTDKPAPIRWLRQCGCPCAKKKSILTIESARKIPRELVVKKQNLSKSKRKKISAENTHKSEVDLGKFSIFIFVVVSCVIMFPDISNLLITIWKWFKVRVTVKKSIIA